MRNGAKVINMSWGSSVPCLTHYMVFKGFRDEEEYKDVVLLHLQVIPIQAHQNIPLLMALDILKKRKNMILH